MESNNEGGVDGAGARPPDSPVGPPAVDVALCTRPPADPEAAAGDALRAGLESLFDRAGRPLPWRGRMHGVVLSPGDMRRLNAACGRLDAKAPAWAEAARPSGALRRRSTSSSKSSSESALKRSSTVDFAAAVPIAFSTCLPSGPSE